MKVILVFMTLSFSFATQAKDLGILRDQVKEIFYHAYNGYLNNAFPYDELRPLTCDGVNTWGSFSLTLIDVLDTLAVLGNHTEFERVSNILVESLDFNQNVNVSVFETNIRVVGGLLSAHMLSNKAGVKVQPEWPCKGPLLELAVKAATKLMPAFSSPTGMPYGTVNLKYGLDPNETPETCTAGVGTFILEFATLSRLTGDQSFEIAARKALKSLYKSKSSIGLVGNHINVKTGKWTALDSGVGAGVDSFFEYLVKGSILLNEPQLMEMFREFLVPIEKYVKQSDWYMWANMNTGHASMPVHQSLDAFWPGLQTLYGETEDAYKTFLNYFEAWQQFGASPEFYSVPHKAPVKNREGYPLRPELIESALYLYRATKDDIFLEFGEFLLHAINTTARTNCGFATIKDVRDHRLDNRMESFFLSETIKYLYLLFDPDNELLHPGINTTVRSFPDGRKCVLGAGGYIFNTEAHPIDVSALPCCDTKRWEQERDELWEIFDELKPNFLDVNHRTWDLNRRPSGSDPFEIPTGRTLNGSLLEEIFTCKLQPFYVRFMKRGQIFVDN